MVGGARPLVLLVDDHEDTREIFAVFLRTQGFDIVVAADPDEALAFVRHTRPDVVLTDLFARPRNLARDSSTDVEGQLQDPLAIVRRLRAEPHLAQLAIVVMTGWSAEQHRREALEQLGCAAYLTKPIAADILVATLRQALAKGAT
jgi:CheY-like chemotaxis protein